MFLPKAIFFICAIASSVSFAQNFNDEVSFQYIKRLIQTKNIKTIDELLAQLPSQYRTYYTLMFKSRSLQEGSFQSPRTIIYGKDARTVIAFNGDPNQKGYDRLEIVEFNDKTKSFEFHEVEFPADAGRPGNVHFSETNPKRCADCHGSDLRPNWEGYPLWPGAYGGLDDRKISTQSDTEQGYGDVKKRMEKAGVELVKGGHAHGDRFFVHQAGEPENLDKFIEKAPSRPRYRSIPNLKIHYQVGYGDDANLNDSFAGSSNSNLTTKFARMNFQRIVRILKSSPNYARFKYAYAAAAYCALDIPMKAYTPLESVRKRKDLNDGYTLAGLPQRIHALAVESGIQNIQDLSMNFDRDLNDKEAMSTPGNDTQEFGDALTAADDDLKKYFKLGEAGILDIKAKCGELAQLSLHALSGFDSGNATDGATLTPAGHAGPSPGPIAQPTGTSMSSASTKQMLARTCMSCHAVPTSPLYIPFNNEQALRKRLKDLALRPPAQRPGATLKETLLYRISKDTPTDHRMPYGLPPLSPLEFESVRQYLNSLSDEPSANQEDAGSPPPSSYGAHGNSAP